MTSVLEFIAARLGKRVQSPGGLGGECVDLIELWARHLGKAVIPGNAVDLARLAPAGDWTVVANAPENYPPPGAIVVWHASAVAGTGAYGHTAICLYADPLWLVTADQNWPTGAPVGLHLHGYAGITGWLIPR